MLDDSRAPRSVKHNTYIPNLDGLSDTVAWTVMPAWFCILQGYQLEIYSVENQQATHFCTEYEVVTLQINTYIDTSELDLLVPV